MISAASYQAGLRAQISDNKSSRMASEKHQQASEVAAVEQNVCWPPPCVQLGVPHAAGAAFCMQSSSWNHTSDALDISA